MDDLITALQIFRKYGNPTCPTHCEHDVLYVMVNPEDVSPEDTHELQNLGFRVNPEYNNFLSYKYGSA